MTREADDDDCDSLLNRLRGLTAEVLLCCIFNLGSCE